MFPIKKALIARGVSEVVTWSFISELEAKLFARLEEIIKLETPINQSLSTLRPSLLPSLLLAVKRNNSFYMKGGAIFETGNVYKIFEHYKQSFNISVVRFGVQVYKTWRLKQKLTDSFISKKDAITILSSLGVDVTKLIVEINNLPHYYHPFRSGYLVIKPSNKIAIFGEIHPNILKYFDLEGIKVSFTEIFFNKIKDLKEHYISSFYISHYPCVIRNFAFLLDKFILAQDLLSAVCYVDIDLIQKISIFDIYDGEKIKKGKKSLAISIVLGSKVKTLTELEINKISLKIINSVNRYVGGVLRR